MLRTLSFFFLLLVIPAGELRAQDPGKLEIGTVRTELIYATDAELGDLTVLGANAKVLNESETKPLTKSKHIPVFKHFVRLGSQDQPLLRGYKNWAQPMANSKAIMVTFQPQGQVNKKERIDLELWQNEKMVLRADPTLNQGERVYILGPKWRGGNLIITIQLLSLKSR